jgi:hypothetical protein
MQRIKDQFSDYMTEKEAADYLGKKKGTLRHWRYHTKTGPTYYKVGATVFYRLSDLKKFVEGAVIIPRKGKTQ